MGMTGKLRYSHDTKEEFKYNYLTVFLENDHRLIFQDPRLFGGFYMSILKKCHWGRNAIRINRCRMNLLR